mmetsp:Transcript_3651/g.6394  ORF Transcript_3651/g.6394 Transcript_3651/m.6394 type:complete len:136 (-) Transcript_3651:3474-3881(-)
MEYSVMNHPILSVCLSQDQMCLLVSCLGSLLVLFDVLSGEVLALYKGHTAESFAVQAQLCLNDQGVVCGSEDGQLRYWDLLDGSDHGPSWISAHVGQENNAEHQSILASISTFDNQCVSASHDGSICLWRAIPNS